MAARAGQVIPASLIGHFAPALDCARSPLANSEIFATWFEAGASVALPSRVEYGDYQRLCHPITGCTPWIGSSTRDTGVGLVAMDLAAPGLAAVIDTETGELPVPVVAGHFAGTVDGTEIAGHVAAECALTEGSRLRTMDEDTYGFDVAMAVSSRGVSTR